MSEQNQGLVSIDERAEIGMITVRADLSSAEVVAALGGAGVTVPGQGEVAGEALWMSPDELLIVMDYDAAEARYAALTSALSGMHSLVVNVSDARSVFRISGSESMVREVLAKLSPADLRATSLPVGRVRRTRIAQVPAAFWFDNEGATLICFRSVRDYVSGLLETSAKAESAVGYF